MWLTGLVAPRHVGSSQTRARTRVPCTGRQTLNHCATREARGEVFWEGLTETQRLRKLLKMDNILFVYFFKRYNITNEIMSLAATWMDLGIIILSEVSQTKTNI